MTAKKIEKLKDDIIKLLQKNGMWIDVYIYCNGKCWALPIKRRNTSDMTANRSFSRTTRTA